jgi:biotin carboxyl carrier protein
MQKTIRFEIDGKIHEVGVERAGKRLTLTHEGKSYTLSLLPEPDALRDAPGASRPGPGSAAALTPAASSPAAAIPAATAAAAVPPAAAPTTAAGSAAAIDSSGSLHAPMTGVIKEIKVAPGHSVKEGEVVLIMEAMKMDIDVPSPVSGIVAEVLVKGGDTVSARQQLMVIH